MVSLSNRASESLISISTGLTPSIPVSTGIIPATATVESPAATACAIDFEESKEVFWATEDS